MPKRRGKAKGLKASTVVKQLGADNANGDVEVAPSPLPVSAKVCRLCESKEGPFLNLFDGEKNTAKKIEELMSFAVAENDELPQNICFRCSAKVEELYEFVQKCIKTQESIYNSTGKKYPNSKIKMQKSLWEENLNRSNVSIDDVCDAVIKKAMKGIKDIPLQSLPESANLPVPKGTEKRTASVSKASTEKQNKGLNYTEKRESENKQDDTACSSAQLSKEKCDDVQPPKTRSSRLNKDAPSPKNDPVFKLIFKKPEKPAETSQVPVNEIEGTKPAATLQVPVNEVAESTIAPIHSNLGMTKCYKPHNGKGVDANILEKKIEAIATVKPFNIMDHISMIKVNGVGLLYQCKLCNRNFLKKDLVLSHWCAKNGGAKDNFTKRTVPLNPPKIPNVKYIYTKVDTPKINNQVDVKIVQGTKPIENKIESRTENDNYEQKCVESKLKPKIGPASKTGRAGNETASTSNPESNLILQVKQTSSQEKQNSVVQMPAIPSLNCPYELVPGPNNTFTLVEAGPTGQKEVKNLIEHVAKKRILSEGDNEAEGSVKQRKVLRSEIAFKPDSIKKRNSDGIQLTIRDQKETVAQPYPVGLFHRSKIEKRQPTPAVAPFGTSAQKKQSYTVVQTGNPSKLLISAKPQPQKEEPPKKKKKNQKY